MKRAVAVVPLLLLTLLLASACGTGSGDSPGDSSTGPEPTTASPQPSQSTQTSEPVSRPEVTGTVASNLEVPWGIAFLPDGSAPAGTALVTERDRGWITRIEPGEEPLQLRRIEATAPRGEAGLLGIALSPNSENYFLYVSTESDNRILRGTTDGAHTSVPEPILTGIPNGFIHDGGRMVFGPDGFLYISTGETGDGDLAQDKDSLGGKVLRITEDGEPAPGNPFIGKDGADEVFSWGHRNIQGLAFDDDGNLWASEFGSNAWDELNLIESGVNYGWPHVEGRGQQQGFRNPQVVWRTDEASPSGLAFAEGHLWMASLRGARLWRVQVEDGRASRPTDFLVGEYGRLRSVAVAPDGNLWVTTSNHDGRGDPAAEDDRILLVRP